MRTEFIITVKHPNGKVDRSSYMGKKWGDEAANRAQAFYGAKGCEVHYYKSQFIGNSLCKQEQFF